MLRAGPPWGRLSSPVTVDCTSSVLVVSQRLHLHVPVLSSGGGVSRFTAEPPLPTLPCPRPEWRGLHVTAGGFSASSNNESVQCFWEPTPHSCWPLFFMESPQMRWLAPKLVNNCSFRVRPFFPFGPSNGRDEFQRVGVGALHQTATLLMLGPSERGSGSQLYSVVQE